MLGGLFRYMSQSTDDLFYSIARVVLEECCRKRSSMTAREYADGLLIIAEEMFSEYDAEDGKITLMEEQYGKFSSSKQN